ncbi:MAG: hypothetical protein QXX12_03620 [Nanopusillaceae archaeon]
MWSVSVGGKHLTLGSVVFYLHKVAKPLAIIGVLIAIGMFISLFSTYRSISSKKDELIAKEEEERRLANVVESLKRTPPKRLKDKEEVYILLTGLARTYLVSADINMNTSSVNIEDVRFNALNVKISCACPGEFFLRFYEDLKREYEWVRLEKMNVAGGRINAEFTVFVR